MTFPTYSDYRDAGVEWLGQLPNHWRDAQVRRVFRIHNGATPTSGYDDYWGGGIPWITPDDLGRLKSQRIAATQRTLTESGYRSCGTALVPPGSLIVSTRAPVGYVAITSVNACTNQGCRALVPNIPVDPRFYAYHMRACAEFLQAISGGSTFQELSSSSLSAFRLSLPPIEEQCAIADFLDHETARIDALIEEQRRLIGLLQEKQQSVISHTITEGVNLKARLIDTEIPWIGCIPKHWELTRIGWASLRLTYGFTNPMPVEDDGPKMLTANDIDWGLIRYGSARSTSEDAYQSLLTEKSRPKKGDVLVTKDGSLGRVAVHDGTQACINQSVALIRPRSDKVLPEFLRYALTASSYQEKLLFDAGGTTIRHLYITRIAQTQIALPPLAEQQAIVHQIEHVNFRYQQLLDETNHQIDLLKERRSALVSAAVTGKVDLREWDQSALAGDQILPQVAEKEDRYG